MRKVSKVQVESEMITGFVCNVCAAESGVNEWEGVSITKVFGFWSEFFGDMSVLKLEICEKCLYGIVKTTAIAPVHETVGLDTDLS